MDKTNKLRTIIILVFILITVVAAYLLHKGTLPPLPGLPKPAEKVQQKPEADESFTYEAQVSVGENGFLPSSLTVRVHTRVYWKDADGNTKSFRIQASPGGDSAKDLGSEGDIGPGNGYAYSFHKLGTFRYHDALNPTVNGEVIVIEDK